jgi:hypothetical protein
MARKKIIKRKPKVLPKLVIKKIVKSKKVQKSTDATGVPVFNIPTPTIEKAVPPIPVKYDGATVVKILAENETAKHCQMSNGTTAWIPKSVFNE